MSGIIRTDNGQCYPYGHDALITPGRDDQGMGSDEQAVDIKTMAQILNVSTATLYSLIRRGEVPAMQIGSLWRMFPSKVIARFEAVAVEDSTPTPGSWKQSPRSAAAHKAAETRRRLAADRAKREQG